MRVKIVKGMSGEVLYKSGDIVDFPPLKAKRLIANKMAEAVNPDDLKEEESFRTATEKVDAEYAVPIEIPEPTPKPKRRRRRRVKK